MKISSSYGAERSGKEADITLGKRAPDKAVPGSTSVSGMTGVGIDTVTITKDHIIQKPAVYSMSELKGKADSALLAQAALQKKGADKPEPLIDSQAGASRQELIELTRLRMSAGFYNRPDVIDAMAKKIIDSF